MNETEIIKAVFPYTRKECIADFINLKQIPCDKINSASHIGNKFVNYFTLRERYHTKPNKGFSYFDTIYQFEEIYQKNWFRNALHRLHPDFVELNQIDKIKALKHTYGLYANAP
jgi:hypothetical protein